MATKVKNMTYEQRVKYFASAPRATVGELQQIIDGNIRRFWVGKLRGTIVTRKDGLYKFDTKAEALDCARGFRTHANELKDYYATRVWPK